MNSTNISCSLNLVSPIRTRCFYLRRLDCLSRVHKSPWCLFLIIFSSLKQGNEHLFLLNSRSSDMLPVNHLRFIIQYKTGNRFYQFTPPSCNICQLIRYAGESSHVNFVFSLVRPVIAFLFLAKFANAGIRIYGFTSFPV